MGAREQRGPFLRQEGALHRAAMVYFHGQDWRQQLSRLEAEGEDGAEAGGPRGETPAPASANALLAESAGVGPHAITPASAAAEAVVVRSAGGAESEAGSSFSQGSWAGVSDALLLRHLEHAFDPTTESLGDFEGRVVRTVAVMELRSLAVDGTRVQRLIIQARYSMDVAGLEPSEAARTLRGHLARILESEGDDPGAALRSEVLVDMLRMLPMTNNSLMGQLFALSGSSRGSASVGAAAAGATPEQLRERTPPPRRALEQETREEAGRASRPAWGSIHSPLWGSR